MLETAENMALAKLKVIARVKMVIAKVKMVIVAKALRIMLVEGEMEEVSVSASSLHPLLC